MNRFDLRIAPSLPTRLTLALAALGLAVGLAACGKAKEAVTEKATEKMLEAQINQNGSDAKVNLGEGGVKVEGKDEHGKAFSMEMGSADIPEKELGIPFYPGAKPVEGKRGTRIVNEQGMMLQVELASSDDPKKVADWYRTQLKGESTEGRMVIDQAKDKGGSITITDTKTESSVMVDVSDDGNAGSNISLMRSGKAKS